MEKLGMQRLVAIILFLISAVLCVVGTIGVATRQNDASEKILSDMRVQAVLSTSGVGVVDAMVNAAKIEKQQSMRAEGASLKEVREAVALVEEEVRATAKPPEVDITHLDTTNLKATILQLETAMRAYTTQELKDIDAYTLRMSNENSSSAEEDVLLNQGPADADAEADILSDDLMLEEAEPKVDLSGFAATPEMIALQVAVDEKYVILSKELQTIFPNVTDETFESLKPQILAQVYQTNDKFETQYDRFVPYSDTILAKNPLQPRIIRFGDDMVTIGIALILLGLLVMFYQQLLKALGLPRLIIGSFLVLLCVLAVIYDLSITTLLSNTLVRMGMNSILVLAMVPAIQCGISLNLGLPIGIIGGLLGGLLCIEFGFSGWGGFAFAIGVGIMLSTLFGYLYAKLLNRLKGSEMAVTTYVGYSFVSLMCIAWLLLPFQSLELRWPMGTGLRVTLSTASSYKHILNNLFSFNIGGFTVPTGLLLFMGLCCMLVWLFQRSKTGTAMQAVGNNPRFAEATGINVDRMRTIGTILSTVLGAVGILVYSQSYGFMQLYTAPRQMGFVAASAILIGGASTSRARISHVLIGTFLFQGVLTLGMPVANVLVPQSTFSETLRILISNGIILYALTKSGGGSRG